MKVGAGWGSHRGLPSWLEDAPLRALTRPLHSACTSLVCLQWEEPYEGTSPIGLGTPKQPHFNLIASLKTLSPYMNMPWGAQSCHFNIWIWGRGLSAARNTYRESEIITRIVSQLNVFWVPVLLTSFGQWFGQWCVGMWRVVTEWRVQPSRHASPAGTHRWIVALLSPLFSKLWDLIHRHIAYHRPLSKDISSPCPPAKPLLTAQLSKVVLGEGAHGKAMQPAALWCHSLELPVKATSPLWSIVLATWAPQLFPKGLPEIPPYKVFQEIPPCGVQSLSCTVGMLLRTFSSRFLVCLSEDLIRELTFQVQCSKTFLSPLRTVENPSFLWEKKI